VTTSRTTGTANLNDDDDDDDDDRGGEARETTRTTEVRDTNHRRRHGPPTTHGRACDVWRVITKEIINTTRVSFMMARARVSMDALQRYSILQDATK